MHDNHGHVICVTTPGDWEPETNKEEEFKEYNRRYAENIKGKIDGIIDSGICPNDYSLAQIFDKT